MEAHNNNSGMKTRGSREGAKLAKGDKNLFLSCQEFEVASEPRLGSRGEGDRALVQSWTKR